MSDLLRLADEVEAALRRHVIDAWFPRCIDTHRGGFYSNFARDWRPEPSDGKFSVFQGRLTWIAAEAAARRADLRARLLPAVNHGVKYLRDVMWDHEHGGFFWGLNDNGQISASFGDQKQLYGMNFCVYGLAAAHRASDDADALELAQCAFRWIDDHAHDAHNGGYLEWLARDGSALKLKGDADRDPSTCRPGDDFPVGRKSMNTHIHLLESFTALYAVWKDPTLRQRLEELLTIVRDRICIEPGAMNLFFTEDWNPISNRDSYGHNIETAYLLLEAADVLGIERDSRTAHMAKMLVDHSLEIGFDPTHGGFFNEGPMLGPADDLDKGWWVQTEGLNALLLMHEKHGSSTSRYLGAFEKQWRFIHKHLIDHTHDGLFQTLAPDGTLKTATKGQIWKCAYHDGRAFLNVSDRLRNLLPAHSVRIDDEPRYVDEVLWVPGYQYLPVRDRNGGNLYVAIARHLPAPEQHRFDRSELVRCCFIKLQDRQPGQDPLDAHQFALPIVCKFRPNPKLRIVDSRCDERFTFVEDPRDVRCGAPV